MEQTVFAASFHQLEVDLDYYHGKDLVHRGCLLRIDPDHSWSRISGKMRNKVRKARKLDVHVERVAGSAADLAAFRAVWFDSADPTLPAELGADEVMYLSRLGGEVVGGLILTPSSPTVLYMHNLASDERGKRHDIPALTLWHAVEDLAGGPWRYIDVGVSFRPTLYRFFANWRTDSYPITFAAPQLRPDIRLTPFSAAHVPVYAGDAPAAAREAVLDRFGDACTVLPSAGHCLRALVQHLQLDGADEVAVFTTFDHEGVPTWLAATLADRCTPTAGLGGRPRAVLVVHEFGIPCERVAELRAATTAWGIPLVEFCDGGDGGSLDDGRALGAIGDFAVHDLTRGVPLPFGGLLAGLAIPDEVAWSSYGMLDHFKRELVFSALYRHLPLLDAAAAQRRDNWAYLDQLFDRDGFTALRPLPPGCSPGAYVVRVADAPALRARYESFGVETALVHGTDALAVPVHQDLTPNQLDYVYAVFRGTLNLSVDYRRGGAGS